MKKTIFSKQGQLISNAVKEMRTQSEYTSRELSKRLGKGHSFISNCELNERRVDLAEFYWICKECGVSPQKKITELIKSFEKLK